MRHNMDSCNQGGEDRDEAWLDGPVTSVKGKSEALKRETTCDSESWVRLGTDGPRQR
jgi:hypothetical protein